MKKKKGFTMVELLATIAIIAALTTLAIVGVNTVRPSHQLLRLVQLR